MHLVNPNTTNSTIAMNFVNNNISNNAGTGVNLSLVAGQQDLQASFAGNTISTNASGAGINIHLADNHNMTGGFDSNTINGNGGSGNQLHHGCQWY